MEIFDDYINKYLIWNSQSKYFKLRNYIYCETFHVHKSKFFFFFTD